jgi:hypothetical protein
MSFIPSNYTREVEYTPDYVYAVYPARALSVHDFCFT